MSSIGNNHSLGRINDWVDLRDFVTTLAKTKATKDTAATEVFFTIKGKASLGKFALFDIFKRIKVVVKSEPLSATNEKLIRQITEKFKEICNDNAIACVLIDKIIPKTQTSEELNQQGNSKESSDDAKKEDPISPYII